MAVKTFTTEVLTSADTNTYLANSGLVYVGSSTIGSGVLTHTVSSAFNSTYDNYRIVIGGGVGSGLSSFTLKLGASTTGYYEIVNYGSYATPTVPLSAGAANGSSFSFVGYMGASYQQASFDLINPNKAQWTSLNGSSWAAGTVAGMSCGVHQVATAYTDFTLGTNGGVTMTGGTVTVYGYRKA